MSAVEGVVGKYQVQAELGRGSFGIVYLGYQADLDRKVAIKELAPQLAGDPAFLQTFRYEAQVMASLDHPNCVKVYDFIETGGHAFLVSEFIEGASLRRVLETAGRLSPQQALGVLKGSLMGLGYAHQRGLVHRDIKPENILADRAGVSKLADFGQSIYAVGPGAAGGLTGSPAYMSPEQAQGGRMDARSDLYSAGAVLYEFLAGRPPFTGDSAIAVMRMHGTNPVPDPRSFNPALPAEANALVQRALAKDPAYRFQSADEFLAHLEATAVAGYGRDWERTAAISGLVAGAAAVAAGAGVAAAGGGTAAAAGGGISLTSTPVIATGVGVGVVATAAVVAVVVLGSIFGKNLVVNGDGEAGSAATSDTAIVAPQGWTTTGAFTAVQYGTPNFIKGSDPGPPDRGKTFFAGGPSNPQSSATQTIDVSGSSGAIDGGDKKYVLSAWLGGFESQDDNASVIATFADANGRALKAATIGPVLASVRNQGSKLIKTQAEGLVPRGTRKIIVRVIMVRTAGSYNDGYADDISLVLS